MSAMLSDISHNILKGSLPLIICSLIANFILDDYEKSIIKNTLFFLLCSYLVGKLT